MELILYSTEGCCLCERLETLMTPHLDRLQRQAGVRLIKRYIAENPVWLETYRYRIPVFVCDGQVLLEGRPQPDEVEQVFQRLFEKSASNLLKKQPPSQSMRRSGAGGGQPQHHN